MEQSLGSFDREISDCEDADRGNFSGAAGLAAAQGSEDLDNIFIRGQQLPIGLQEAGEAVSKTL